jgi:hypothetical protein
MAKGYIYAIYYDKEGIRFAYIGSTMRKPMERFIEHRMEWRKNKRGGCTSWKVFRCGREKVRFGVMEVLHNTTPGCLRRVEEAYIDAFQCVNCYINYNNRERKRPRIGLPFVEVTYSFPIESVEQALQLAIDRSILSSLSFDTEHGDTYSEESSGGVSSTGDGTLNSLSAA